MEKKTMGKFIAALRKANGMTQAELAEKLHVSDKSVSRWERDETAPDLTLIPVIAEIFGVTSDELLRGERSRGTDADQTTGTTQKSEKQLKYILKRSKSNFTVKSIIAMAMILLGIILILFDIDSYKLRELQPIICTCLAIAGLIMEIVFVISTYSAVNEDEFGEKQVNELKIYMVKVLKITIYLFLFFALYLHWPFIKEEAWTLLIDIIPVYWMSFFVNKVIDLVIKKKNLLTLSDDQKKKMKIYNWISILSMMAVVAFWVIIVTFHLFE